MEVDQLRPRQRGLAPTPPLPSRSHAEQCYVPRLVELILFRTLILKLSERNEKSGGRCQEAARTKGSAVQRPTPKTQTVNDLPEISKFAPFSPSPFLSSCSLGNGVEEKPSICTDC